MNLINYDYEVNDNYAHCMMLLYQSYTPHRKGKVTRNLNKKLMC